MFWQKTALKSADFKLVGEGTLVFKPVSSQADRLLRRLRLLRRQFLPRRRLLRLAPMTQSAETAAAAFCGEELQMFVRLRL